MSKTRKNNHLPAQRGLVAIAMSASLFAFACTTDRNLGNGKLNDRSGVRMTPTSGLSTGSETPPMPVPMTSSYSRPETGPAVSRSMQKLSAEDAALLMAQHRSTVRVLGPASPDGSGSSSSGPGALITSSSDISYGTAEVSREGSTTVSVPTTARNINPTSTAMNVNPTSTARSIRPATSAVNINPTTTSTVRVVNDGRRVTVTNQ